jgi:hypothetical protein
MQVSDQKHHKSRWFQVTWFQAPNLMPPRSPLTPPVAGLTRLGISVFFDGTSATSTNEQLLAIAPKHPVFMLDDAA